MTTPFHAWPCPKTGCDEFLPCGKHGRPKPPDDHELLDAMVGEIGGLLDGLTAQGHRLIDRARISTAPDSFPRTASGGERGPASSVRWCDEHECDLEDCLKRGDNCNGVPVDTVSDPTGDAVIARLDDGGPDELRRRARRFLNGVRSGAMSLQSAMAIESSASNRTKFEPADEMWCTSCKRVNSWSVRFRGDLCNWCYKNRLTDGSPPPIALVDKHARGIRIMATDWARHGYDVAS